MGSRQVSKIATFFLRGFHGTPHASFFVDRGKDTWMDSDVILQRSSKKKQLLRGFEG